MNKDELRVKVAELCEWKRAECQCGCDEKWWAPGVSFPVAIPPAYSESWDAIMPEILKRAEAALDWAVAFEENLCQPGIDFELQLLWARTPAELCEAFIKTEEEMRK